MSLRLASTVLRLLMIGLRDLHLAHKDLGILMDSWMIVGPNDTGLSSTATGS